MRCGMVARGLRCAGAWVTRGLGAISRLDAELKVGHFLLPEQQVGRQQHHELARRHRRVHLQVAPDVVVLTDADAVVRDEDGRLAVEHVEGGTARGCSGRRGAG